MEVLVDKISDKIKTESIIKSTGVDYSTNNLIITLIDDRTIEIPLSDILEEKIRVMKLHQFKTNTKGESYEEVCDLKEGYIQLTDKSFLVLDTEVPYTCKNQDLDDRIRDLLLEESNKIVYLSEIE